MKNIFEKFLISILLATSVLLGLSFWLNIKFHFNLFSLNHWNTLAQLQASHTSIDKAFYISICIAIFIFMFGLVVILTYKHAQKENIKPIHTETKPENIPASQIQQQSAVSEEHTIPEQQPSVLLTRPPRLNLPKNMGQVAAAIHNNNQQIQPQSQPKSNIQNTNPYNSTLSEIFSNAGYVVKKLPTILGYTPNLFAIGGNEILWIGGVDCDIETIKKSINKLQETFRETLEDVPINIFSFIIDTKNIYTKANTDNETEIFHDIEECRKFIMEHSAPEIKDDEQDGFNAYSEYIDTIIQYIKNI